MCTKDLLHRLDFGGRKKYPCGKSYRLIRKERKHRERQTAPASDRVAIQRLRDCREQLPAGLRIGGRR